MKNKILAVLLACIAAVSITACTSSSEMNEAKSNELQPIEVKDFGWTLSESGYLHYGIILYNPNEKTVYDYPSFRITAKDANGVVLGTEDQTLSIIYPDETMGYAFQSFECSEMPTDVQVEVLDSEDYKIRDVSTLNRPEHQPFEIVNATMRENKIVGEIINHDTYDYGQVAVSVIFRDNAGKIVGGTTTFVDNLKANGTVPFDLDEIWYSDFKSDNYEIYANIWD